MEQIRLWIEIEPVAKGRPRFSKHGAYTPKKTKVYEDAIKAAYTAQHGGDTPLFKKGIPLEVVAVFGKSVPKSYSKKRRQACLAHRECPVGRPDVDNYLKAVLDALNGLAFEDDSQITHTVAWKTYAENPFVRIDIRSEIEWEVD